MSVACIEPPAQRALSPTLRRGCGPTAKLSADAPVAGEIDYMLKRWAAFIQFLDDGQICLSNNTAERAIRPIAVGRHNWTSPARTWAAIELRHSTR